MDILLDYVTEKTQILVIFYLLLKITLHYTPLINLIINYPSLYCYIIGGKPITSKLFLRLEL